MFVSQEAHRVKYYMKELLKVLGSKGCWLFVCLFCFHSGSVQELFVSIRLVLSLNFLSLVLFQPLCFVALMIGCFLWVWQLLFS